MGSDLRVFPKVFHADQDIMLYADLKFYMKLQLPSSGASQLLVLILSCLSLSFFVRVHTRVIPLCLSVKSALTLFYTRLSTTNRSVATSGLPR
jgi:hypothetical protein